MLVGDRGIDAGSEAWPPGCRCGDPACHAQRGY